MGAGVLPPAAADETHVCVRRTYRAESAGPPAALGWGCLPRALAKIHTSIPYPALVYTPTMVAIAVFLGLFAIGVFGAREQRKALPTAQQDALIERIEHLALMHAPLRNDPESPMLLAAQICDEISTFRATHPRPSQTVPLAELMRP